MKVGIIGAGNVGATAAYAMVMQGTVSDIVLVDLDEKRAQAEASDILHAVPFSHRASVAAVGYEGLEGAGIVVITAGSKQKPDETRLDLLGRNAKIMRSIVERVLEHAPDAILIIVSNPVDVLTHLAARAAAEHGVPAGRVLGSGTTLDTARFRALLGNHLGVDPQHVHGYVVGEHGDSEVLTWSIVDIGGLPLDEYVQMRGIRMDEETRLRIDDEVRNAAYKIIEGKGATYYGIGNAIAHIVDTVAHNHRALLTVCAPTADVQGVKDVTVSLPSLVTGSGVVTTLPLPLSDEENQALHDSAQTIRTYIDELGQQG